MLKVIILESVAFMGVFCLINIYFERPFLIGIVYWIIWESIVSGQNYQKITITHYLDSIIFDSMLDEGKDVSNYDREDLMNEKYDLTMKRIDHPKVRSAWEDNVPYKKKLIFKKN